MNLHFMNLLEGLDDQKIISPSRREAPESAEILGEVPEELQQLFSRATETKREFERAALEFTHCDDPGMENDLRAKAMKLQEEHDLLANAFWYEIRVQHNLFGEPALSVDKHWRVYRQSREENLIRSIFGLGQDLDLGHDTCGDPNCPIHGRAEVPSQVN